MTVDYYKGAGAAVYETAHGDIFNPIEQQRLHNSLRDAIQAVQTDSTPLTALDYGCGSGNLTRHLIDLGVHTVSADVSDDFLKAIERNFADTALSETLKINGADLTNVPDGRFDLVASYSVLHHVPDYLAIVAEMCSCSSAQVRGLRRLTCLGETVRRLLPRLTCRGPVVVARPFCSRKT